VDGITAVYVDLFGDVIGGRWAPAQWPAGRRAPVRAQDRLRGDVPAGLAA
jgi:hypothetical protein